MADVQIQSPPSAPVPTLPQVLAASNIAPVPDGTHIVGIGITDNGQVTTTSGIVTSAIDIT